MNRAGGSKLDLPAGSLALGRTSSALGLLCLLRTLRRSPLLLRLLSSSRALRRTSLRAHGPALLDHIERGTNNSTLRLDLTATAGLGLLLLRL